MIALFLVKIAMAFTAICVLFIGMFFLLRLFDVLLGVNFKEAFNKIEEDGKALALYYGLRNLGASIAIGLVVCIALIM